VTGGGNVLLAFDFGRRRIGVATGNALTRTASPLTTLSVKDEIPWQALDRLLASWKPDLLVVGRPPDAGETSIVERVLEFAAGLEQRYGLVVELVDESLTSTAARSEIREGRRSGFLRRRAGKGNLDRHAACLIAEQWLSGNAHAG
jgi:putative Holliday junction resolvase